MKKLLLFLAIVSLASCQGDGSKLRTFDFGDFTVSLPKDTDKEEIPSMESQLMNLESEYGTFRLDYGLHTATLPLSPEEYLEQRAWEGKHKLGFVTQYESNGTFKAYEPLDDKWYTASYDISECLKSRKCILLPEENLNEQKFRTEYIRNLKITDSVFTYEFTLPDEYKFLEFEVKDAGSVYKRVVMPKQLNQHTAGVYIVLKNTCDEEGLCKTLSLWAIDSVRLTKEDLNEVLNSVVFNQVNN